MPTLVDLVNQVQKILPARFGGTGNAYGWGRDAVVAAYPNGSTTLTRGTVVQVAADYTFGGGAIISAPILKKTSTANQQNVLGVVVGHFSWTDPVGQFLDEDVPAYESAAICLLGRCIVDVEGSVVTGQYAYSAATDGLARSSSDVEIGAMGIFETSGSTRQWVRLWGSAGAQGEPVTQYSAIEGTIGDGDTIVAVGAEIHIEVPFDCDIYRSTIVANSAGSIRFGVYRATYANVATYTNIAGLAQPEIVAGVKTQDSVLANWTTALDRGDWLRFLVLSCTSIEQATLSLSVTKRRP